MACKKSTALSLGKTEQQNQMLHGQPVLRGETRGVAKVTRLHLWPKLISAVPVKVPPFP